MKFSILIFSLVIFGQAQADNWMRPQELAQGLSRGFELKETCELGGNVCQQVDGLDLEALKIEILKSDDLSKPLYEAKTNLTQCETREACDEARAVEGYCPQTHFSVTNETGSGGWEAYCTRLVGYEKQQKPVIADDQEKKTARQAEMQARSKAAAAKAARREALSKAKIDGSLSQAEVREILKLLKDEILQGD